MESVAAKLNIEIDTERPIDEVFDELIQKAEKQNRGNLVNKLNQKQKVVTRTRRLSYLLGAASVIAAVFGVTSLIRH